MADVYYQKTQDRKDFVLKVLKLFRAEIEKKESFLIKPNIVSSESYPTTTHPEVLEAVLEFLIHTHTQITGALKNQFGYLTRAEKIWMHMGVKDIHKGIAEINAIAKPNLFIVDAIQTLIDAQEARHGGQLKDLGYMLAGSDAVALDCFGLKLLQPFVPSLGSKSPQDVPHIKHATAYGLGSPRFEEREL